MSRKRGPHGTYLPSDEQRELVKQMIGNGITQDLIAKVLGISVPTLHKHFRHELDVGAIEANNLVANALFQKAIGPGKEGVTAAIFWLKCRARWTERDREVEDMGKKQLRDEVAKTAGGEGTEWGDDLKFQQSRAVN